MSLPSCWSSEPAQIESLPSTNPARILTVMSQDPVVSNPDAYSILFENDRVRVLEYRDQPGHRTTPHAHPDSFMYTLSNFRRRLHGADTHRDVEMSAGHAGWLAAQVHAGENIGETDTHVLFVELKSAAVETSVPPLGSSS
jgi:beta-alanine degradation protein BauB